MASCGKGVVYRPQHDISSLLIAGKTGSVDKLSTNYL